MKNHWLRGLLLGVSVAVLLAGGVALAQSVSVDVDEECFECIPLDYETDIPYDPFLFTVTGSGWMPGDAAVGVEFSFGSGKTETT